MPNQNFLPDKLDRIRAAHRCEMGRTALLLIDMQQGFMTPGASLAVPTAWDALPNQQQMVQFCRQHGIPVIFTAFVASPQIPTLRVEPFGVEHVPPAPGDIGGYGRPSGNCQRGATGPESPAIIPELAPLPGEPVIEGYGLDKFYGTPLDLLLRARDIRYLIMAGIMTDLCVLATLFSATSREYRVTLLADGVATLWPEIQQATLDIVTRKLARVLTTTEMIAELEKMV